jgi:membrane-bound lytic murein transglycosylase B
MKVVATLFSLIALAAVAADAQAYDSPIVPLFIDEMVLKHHFHRHELVRVFKEAQFQQSAIDAITAPATLKPWPEYRASFVNDKRVADGLKFWKQNASALRRAEKRYGVPQEIIVALLGVETFYGKQTGGFRTIDALSTLAFNYPPRSDFFRSELEQFLLLASEQRFNLLKVKSSYAGALGLPQFMPSSYRRYAVDFNGNGKVDLIGERADAIGSAANYLKQYGWVRNQPIAVRGNLVEDKEAADVTTARPAVAWAQVGIVPVEPVTSDQPCRLLDFTVAEGKEFWLVYGNFDVIMKYNRSSYYAMTIFQLAEALRAARTH